jgi:hypothetical protein
MDVDASQDVGEEKGDALDIVHLDRAQNLTRSHVGGNRPGERGAWRARGVPDLERGIAVRKGETQTTVLVGDGTGSVSARTAGRCVAKHTLECATNSAGNDGYKRANMDRVLHSPAYVGATGSRSILLTPVESTVIKIGSCEGGPVTRCSVPLRCQDWISRTGRVIRGWGSVVETKSASSSTTRHLQSKECGE